MQRQDKSLFADGDGHSLQQLHVMTTVCVCACVCVSVIQSDPPLAELFIPIRLAELKPSRFPLTK